MGALDLLFPKYCVVCKKQGDYLCSNCFARISFSVSPRCLICERPCIDGLTHPICQTRYSIDGCFSAVAYNGVVKKLLYVFKYSPYLSDLQHFLGSLLFESLIQNETYMQVWETYHPLFVSVPLSSQKMRQRGYNQSLLLAESLSGMQQGRIWDVLERTRATKPQYGLSKEERHENIKGAFGIRPTFTSGEVLSVFLVDDVVTTGSTLVEAANLLKRNGIEKVWGVTFAQD